MLFVSPEYKVVILEICKITQYVNNIRIKAENKNKQYQKYEIKIYIKQKSKISNSIAIIILHIYRHFWRYSWWQRFGDWVWQRFVGQCFVYWECPSFFINRSIITIGSHWQFM